MKLSVQTITVLVCFMLLLMFVNNACVKADSVQPTYVLKTIVGTTGKKGYGGDGGGEVLFDGAASFDVISDSGDVVIADFYNHRIRKYVGGTVNTFIGNGTKISTNLANKLPNTVSNPGKVRYDKKTGDIYYSDYKPTQTSEIVRYDQANNQFLSMPIKAIFSLNIYNNNVYYWNLNNSIVQYVPSSQSYSNYCSWTGNKEFSLINFAFIDDNTLFGVFFNISNNQLQSSNSFLRKIDCKTNSLLAPNQEIVFGTTYAITTVKGGNVLVYDLYSCTVRKVSFATGQQTILFGNGTCNPQDVTDIVSAANGVIYFPDLNSIRSLTPTCTYPYSYDVNTDMCVKSSNGTQPYTSSSRIVNEACCGIEMHILVLLISTLILILQ